MSRASVKPAPWGSTREVVRSAPGWTTRSGTTGTTLKPSPISGTHAISMIPAVEPNDAAPASRRPVLRASADAMPPSSRRPSRLGDDAPPPSSRAPASRIPPSRLALDARVQTLGEALSEARAEAAHLRAELETSRRAVAAQAESFEREAGELIENAERELVRLAMVVARRVVLRELEVDPGLVVTWAREALEGAGFGTALSVSVAPDVARAVAPDAWGDLAGAVATDPHLPSGACEVRDGARTVDVSPEARLRVLTESMGIGSAPPAGAASVPPAGAPRAGSVPPGGAGKEGGA